MKFFNYDFNFSVGLKAETSPIIKTKWPKVLVSFKRHCIVII